MHSHLLLNFLKSALRTALGGRCRSVVENSMIEMDPSGSRNFPVSSFPASPSLATMILRQSRVKVIILAGELPTGDISVEDYYWAYL